MYYGEYGFILFKYLTISHLQNLSSYEIVYGRKPPAMSDLQLESDKLTKPAFYHFTDYLDLLNERIHAIRDIVKEQHNNTIEKRLLKHGSESHCLRSFNDRDMVYCLFPSKTIMPEHNLPSKKMKMNCVGPLYIFSKHNKFMYLLATIDGEVIEQLFHISLYA